MPAASVRFVTAARLITDEARRLGLEVPGFRSPPRLDGVDRSMRRRGAWRQVAVRIRDRPFPDVVADMVDGVVAANHLRGPAASRARAALLAAVAERGGRAA